MTLNGTDKVVASVMDSTWNAIKSDVRLLGVVVSGVILKFSSSEGA